MSARTRLSPLGALHRLPNEIISAVLSELDIGSVLSFRKVDSLARAIVSKLTEFRVVTIHARPCLVAVI